MKSGIWKWIVGVGLLVAVSLLGAVREAPAQRGRTTGSSQSSGTYLAPLEVTVRALSGSDLANSGDSLSVGVVVTKIGQTNASSGLETGDVITAFDGQPIDGLAAAKSYVQGPLGPKVTATVQRVIRSGVVRADTHEISLEVKVDVECFASLVGSPGKQGVCGTGTADEFYYPLGVFRDVGRHGKSDFALVWTSYSSSDQRRFVLLRVDLGSPAGRKIYKRYDMFTTHYSRGKGYPRRVHLVDLDGDGVLQLLVERSSGVTMLLDLFSGEPIWEASGTGVKAICGRSPFYDFNGDGVKDILYFERGKTQSRRSTHEETIRVMSGANGGRLYDLNDKRVPNTRDLCEAGLPDDLRELAGLEEPLPPGCLPLGQGDDCREHISWTTKGFRSLASLVDLHRDGSVEVVGAVSTGTSKSRYGVGLQVRSLDGTVLLAQDDVIDLGQQKSAVWAVGYLDPEASSVGALVCPGGGSVPTSGNAMLANIRDTPANPYGPASRVGVPDDNRRCCNVYRFLEDASVYWPTGKAWSYAHAAPYDQVGADYQTPYLVKNVAQGMAWMVLRGATPFADVEALPAEQRNDVLDAMVHFPGSETMLGRMACDGDSVRFRSAAMMALEEVMKLEASCEGNVAEAAVLEVLASPHDEIHSMALETLGAYGIDTDVLGPFVGSADPMLRDAACTATASLARRAMRPGCAIDRTQVQQLLEQCIVITEKPVKKDVKKARKELQKYLKKLR